MNQLYVLLALILISSCEVNVKDNNVNTGGSSTETSSQTPSRSCKDSPVVGEWSGKILGQEDTLKFNADCSGSSSYCQSGFSFPPVTGIDGIVTIDNQETNGTIGCLDAGRYNCAYELGEDEIGIFMKINCGGDTIVYDFVR